MHLPCLVCVALYSPHAPRHLSRYKHDISGEQKERFKSLLKAQFHYQITAEVRRELYSGHARGEKGANDGSGPLGFAGFSPLGTMDDL